MTQIFTLALQATHTYFTDHTPVRTTYDFASWLFSAGTWGVLHFELARARSLFGKQLQVSLLAQG